MITTLLIIILIYIIYKELKSFFVGPTFSILKYIKYKNDYMKWYSFRQTYIPVKKRVNFNKKTINEN